jgi:uncharacterized membrane protein YccC
MSRLSLWARLRHAADNASRQPDISRAVRATIAFMVPLLLAARGWITLDVSFVALAAQNIAMVDIRGDYRLRFALVVAMAGVFVGAAALGASVAGHLIAAVAAMGVMAAVGGMWRHLSSDYGPGLAISSTLVFLIAASAPAGEVKIGQHAVAALWGGVWGVLVQLATWPLYPEHPLRRAVAESWEAVGDLFEAMAPAAAIESATRHAKVVAAESAVRGALDKTYAVLEAARPGPLRERLERLNMAGARLATRVVALNAALETVMADDAFASLAPALEPALVSLANLSRSVAVTTVSRQPAHLATFEVRLRRLGALLRVLRSRLTTAAHNDAARTQLDEIVRQIDQLLPEIHAALRAMIDRAAERAAFSLELLDLREHALRPLASALNLTWRVDPALLRYTFRLALLTMLGVIVFRYLNLPHGYWLPFTVVVVLQPDYGATRQRAGQRVLGTLAGSVVGSALLWLHPPFWAMMMATAATMFAFGYLVKRNYAFAIFFVTLFIVLLTEANGPVSIAFTAERLGVTLAGGALALLAAHVFWPVWERDRLPAILAHAFRSTRDYFALLATRLATGGSFDREVILAKRRAEAATSAAFSSLQRLNGDPQNQREGLEHAAALVNGNQRIVRALAVVAVNLPPEQPFAAAGLVRLEAVMRRVYDLLAATAEGTAPARGAADELLAALGAMEDVTGAAPPDWLQPHLLRIATELSAMLVAMQDAAAAVGVK